ncbi:hypothetical protein HDU81_004159 [Chytriomyces hyalinus]|nr:hypothetical protein HDU81_004159 [Chytriomyces hyalinus]
MSQALRRDRERDRGVERERDSNRYRESERRSSVAASDRDGQGTSSKRRTLSNAVHSSATDNTNSNSHPSSSFSVNVAVQTQLLRLAQSEHAHVGQRIKALVMAANCNAQQVAHADSNVATLVAALAQAKGKAAEARAIHAKNDAVLAFLTDQQSDLSSKIDKLVAQIGHQLPRESCETIAESGKDLDEERSHQSSNIPVHPTERKRRERTTSPCSESSEQQTNSKKRSASSSPIVRNQEFEIPAYLVDTNTATQVPKPTHMKNDTGQSPKALVTATTSM